MNFPLTGSIQHRRRHLDHFTTPSASKFINAARESTPTASRSPAERIPRIFARPRPLQRARRLTAFATTDNPPREQHTTPQSWVRCTALSPVPERSSRRLQRYANPKDERTDDREARELTATTGRAPGEEEDPQGPREEENHIHSPFRQRHHDRRQAKDEPQPNLVNHSRMTNERKEMGGGKAEAWNEHQRW